jgi:NTP pyrophosphatase (non-canonical NTP hydrolase)
MSEIQGIMKALNQFRDERNWAQFHNVKDLSMALSIEAAELNELFLWKNEEGIEKTDPQRIKDELADILSYAFLIAGKYDFDIPEIMMDKINNNNLRYPVEKSRGNAKKYNDLD